MNNYYSNANVQRRMLEYLGGESLQNVTCEYLTAGDIYASHHRNPLSVTELPRLWQEGKDISRSLWDRESLVCHLDIEYVNFDFPGEVFSNPLRPFWLQRPVELATGAILADYGIRPLHLLSGRGHHYVWQIRRNSEAFRQLASLGQVPLSLQALNDRAHRPDGNKIPADLGNAYAGLGLIMEYLAHRIKEEAAPMSKIPVEFTATETGAGAHGREIVSIDISEYGDPLSTRVIRVPFSYYLKPFQQTYLLNREKAQQLPEMFLIPLNGMGMVPGLAVMRDMEKVLGLAKEADSRIPDLSDFTPNLIAAYQRSPLKNFHDWYYSEDSTRCDLWRDCYGEIPTAQLPICVQYDLARPNDLLLRPGNIRRFVRVMLSLGWHPSHIAGLLQSKFEANYGWGEQWHGYNPALRADFYTRLFADSFVSGRDNLVDFNCQSAKEETLCTTKNCPFNLAFYRDSLLNRRKYERLACRPFNRLFLPEEHL